jgi:hypothetical protein
MKPHVPQWLTDRILRVGGLNRYGEPNYRLAWSQSETHRAGGCWADHYIGYRRVYLANEQPNPPKKGYWMLLEWDAPETFGGEGLYYFLHRDDTNGLCNIGPYPHRGRYKIALKLIWSMIVDGEMIIEAEPLSSKLVDFIIPIIVKARKDSYEKKLAQIKADKLQADRLMSSQIDAALNDAKRPLISQMQLDDRIRLMEKQWAEWLRNPRQLSRGFQMA